MIHPQVHMVPLTLHGIGFHMVPPSCAYGPPSTCRSVFLFYMTVMVPHALYGIGIIWFPTCVYGPPHVLYDSYGPHTLY